MSVNNNTETSSIISSTLCNGFDNTKNNLDNNKNFSLLEFHQITTAQNELISIQRSLIRELLKNSKEFQEKFNDNFNTKNSNQYEQQTSNKGGLECDSMHTDVESIQDEICFVKSFIKGLNGKERIDNVNMKFGSGASTKNKKNDYTFDQIEQNDNDTGFIYSGNSQNNYSSQNDNFFNTEKSFSLHKEASKGGSSTNINNVPFVNESPKGRNDFISSGPNDYLQSSSTSFQNNDYQGNYDETNEINEDSLGEYKGFNSIYVGIGKENVNVHQLKQCLEENFGYVRFIRIIRNKNCAFAEFEDKNCFAAAIESGSVPLNGLSLKINKTFRKKKEI